MSLNSYRCENKHSGGDQGFTLIEVMIAMLILTVGLLSLAHMMVLSTHANMLSGRMTSCSAIAKQQLEQLKAAPFYTEPITATRHPFLVAGGDLDARIGGYSQFYDSDGLVTAVGNALFELRWQIADVLSPLPFEMVRIQVRCLPAAGMQDQFAIIGEALFTTFRSANVS